MQTALRRRGLPSPVRSTSWPNWQPIPDSDDDGIPDATDPDTVGTIVTGLPDPAFDSHGQRTAILSILDDAEAKIAAGDIDGAIGLLANLRRHVDGCETGPAADRNDWIVTCPEQDAARAAIDTLISNLST